MRNKKKVVSLFLVIVMILVNSISVFAASSDEQQKGSIQIMLTNGDIGTSKENVTFEYAKVADLINGEYCLLEAYEEANIDLNNIKYSNELDAAAQKLDKHAVAEGKVVTDQEGKATISDLEIGVYLLRVSDKARYENVYPVLISIPTWNEEEGDMDYDITVIPKHSPNETSKIITGDRNLYTIYATFFIISFIIVLVLSCHNRFKCGKIPFKYLEMGGYTNGNDNDTKNPRCPRRIRQRGSRSVN